MGTMLRDPIADVFFSGAQAAILGLLYAHPDQSYYLRQIVTLTGKGVGEIQRELSRLSHAGVLRRTHVGRHVFFQAHPDCPIYHELRAITTKTIGAADVLRSALEPLLPSIRLAFIYGSVARGQERQASDVDLMVVGTASLADIVAATTLAQNQLHREINPTVYPPHEFAGKVRTSHPFLSQVVRGPKLFLVGGDHELRGLLEERLDQTPRPQPRRNPPPARPRRPRHPPKSRR